MNKLTFYKNWIYIIFITTGRQRTLTWARLFLSTTARPVSFLSNMRCSCKAYCLHDKNFGLGVVCTVTKSGLQSKPIISWWGEYLLGFYEGLDSRQLIHSCLGYAVLDKYRIHCLNQLSVHTGPVFPCTVETRLKPMRTSVMSEWVE